jgi:uncharacterized membrane protein
MMLGSCLPALLASALLLVAFDSGVVLAERQLLGRKQPELTKPALVYRREQLEAPRTTAIQPIAWFISGDAPCTRQHPPSDMPGDVHCRCSVPRLRRDRITHHDHAFPTIMKSSLAATAVVILPIVLAAASWCFSGRLLIVQGFATVVVHHHHHGRRNRPTVVAGPNGGAGRRVSTARLGYDTPNYYRKTKASQLSVTTTTAMTTTMINAFHADPMYCLTGLFLLSAFGIALEQRTNLGKALSAPLATMAAALLCSNVGILPFTSPTYNIINSFAVALAVPMLLFDSNLQKIRKSTKPSLLYSFGLASITVLIGTVVAVKLLPISSVGIPIACALAARHIGGAINFVAVAETLRIPARTVSAAIAADNVVVALYFALLFALAKPGEQEETDRSHGKTTEPPDTVAVVIDEQGEAGPRITLSSIAASFATSAVLVTIGKYWTGRFLPAGTSALPLTSMLTVLAATFLSFDPRLANTGSALGVFLVQLFFAASGAAGSIRLVVTEAPMLVAFSILQILVHFTLLVTLGRRLPLNNLLLASNAAVGGPTTAAAMAQAKGWNVVPALLIGILGYAIATPIALALVPLLQWVLAR